MLTEGQINSVLRSSFIKVILLVAVCYLCYGSSLNGPFVFDDTVAIKQNKAILQLPTNYTAIFTTDFWGAEIRKDDSHKSYRPLTTLMFHLEWTRWKLQPGHMKGINLLLHTINSIMVLMVLGRLDFTKSYDKIAFGASLLFAVHPVHTEAVSGIVSRADLMFCLIYLFCLLMCSGPGRDSWAFPVLIVIFTCVGVLYKETAISIPLACVLINYGLDYLYTLPWRRQVNCLFCKTNIWYAFSTLVILVARLWLADFKTPKFRAADNPVAHADELSTRIYSQNYLYVYNLYILINPLQLCFDWSFGCIRLVESLKDYRLLSVASLYVIIALILFNYIRNFPTIMAVGLFVVPFLPASGIIKVGFVIAERVLYVPSIGFCYLVAYGFTWLCNHCYKYRKFIQIGFCLTVFVFILRCRERSAEWLMEDKLFSSALDVCPNNAKASNKQH